VTPGTVTSAALTARTREVAPRLDILDALAPDGFAWLGDGIAMVTAGVAARVAPADAVAFLRSIVIEAPTRPGPVAVGALPFTDPAEGRLVVPSRVERLDPDGRAWLTEVVPVARPGRTDPSDPSAESVVAGGTGHEPTDRDRWSAAVQRALSEIGAGRLSKVVLARDSVFDAGAPIDRTAVLRRLNAAEVGCFVFADGGFVGASPELLVRRAAGRLLSQPMAGTVPLGGHEPRDGAEGLLRSEKDLREHELVVQAVVDAFGRMGAGPVRVDGPALVRLATVAHLATRVEAPAGGRPSVVEAALALHPTPAVGGTPVGAALATIAALEPAGRGRYAGPVGWVDAEGDGEFAVAIRSAEISGPRARLFAGAGIVAGSDAAAEWEETEAKLEPMRRALGAAATRSA